MLRIRRLPDHPAGPIIGGAGAYDPVRREILLYGGDDCSTSGFFRDALDVVALAD